MSNRTRLRASDRMNSRVRHDVALAERLGMPVHQLRESATETLERPAAQTVTISEATTSPLRSTEGVRRYRARLIASDVQGTTGWYGAQMLRECAAAGVFAAGLPIYADHPTETEEAERPERSIRDLAGRLVTNAVFESDGLYADVEVYPSFVPLVEAMADSIGMSIRASGTAEYGQPEGQRGPLITSIVHAESVDFVTAAGAGGKLVSLLESARAAHLVEARNVEAWMESRIHTDFTVLADEMYGNGKLTREERITLSSAVGDALKAFTTKLQAEAPQLATRDIYQEPPMPDGTAPVTESKKLREAATSDMFRALGAALYDAYGDTAVNGCLWVRDYDPDAKIVWFDLRDTTDVDTYQQPYTASGDGADLAVALTGTRTEVVARTVYTPAPPDDADDAAADAAQMAEAAAAATTNDAPAAAATGDQATAVDTTQTDGTPPTGTTNPPKETSVSGDQNTGPAPGAAGTAEATAVTEAEKARADAAEMKLAESERKNADAELKLARFQAVEAARPIASTILAESQLPAAAQARVLSHVTANVPMTEANVLDEAAFRTVVTEAATAEETYLASVRESAGEGRVSGLGTGNTETTPEQRTAVREGKFRALGMSESAAKIAANGRVGGRI